MNYYGNAVKTKYSIGNIGLDKITMVLFGVYLYLEIVCPHSFYSQVSMIAVVGCSFFCLFGRQKNEAVFYIKLNPILICYGLLILYQCCLLLFGVVENVSATVTDIRTMIISFILLLFVYSYLYKRVSLYSFEKLFVLVGFISVLTVLFLCRDTLGEGRLAHTYREGVSYYFLGVPVAISSNGLATIWALSVYILCFFIKNAKSKTAKCVYIAAIIILVIGVALTGSRKGFLVLAVCFCGFILLSGRQNLLLKVIIVAVSILFLYYLMLSVPVFYQTIGERLEILVNSILGLSDDIEGSMQSRNYYAELALEAISDHPILGYGVGWFSEEFGNVTENDYYETLVSGGLLGFIIWYSFIAVAVIRFLNFKNKDITTRKYMILFVIILIVMWGSVIILSRSYLIYLSLIFLCIDKQKFMRS